MPSCRILFIGNSYTACNNLAGMVAELAGSAEPPSKVETQQLTPGGVTLEWHFGQPQTLETIRQGKWDFVVLQDHSLRPVDAPAKTLEYGLKLDEAVRASGAKTVLYMTWARQHLPEMQETLKAGYLGVAEKTGARVAPVGLAWQKALRSDPTLVLHTEDKSHPNVAGTYLAACVFHVTLFGTRPPEVTEGLKTLVPGFSELSDARLDFFRSIAWETVQELAGAVCATVCSRATVC
jgi:hypothetical protein